MAQCLGKTVETGESSVYGGRWQWRSRSDVARETVPDPGISNSKLLVPNNDSKWRTDVIADRWTMTGDDFVMAYQQRDEVGQITRRRAPWSARPITTDGTDEDVSRIVSTFTPARLAPLQRVLHAAVRIVNGLRPHDHVSLKELHWLPIIQRVDYKLCLLVHKVVVIAMRHPTWLQSPMQSPSLPLSSIPDLKRTCSTNPSHHRSSSYPCTDCPLDFNRTAFTDFVPPCVMF